MARQPFNRRWAQSVEDQDSSTVFKQPTDIRLGTGWEGGVDKDAPPAGEENWWHNRVDSALQGVERTGLMVFHPSAIYALGAPTVGSDGNYYESLVSSNTGNDPTATSGFWRLAGASFFSGNEAGDIKAVAHNNVPSQGWLKCNGAVLARSSYPRLFNMIGTAWNTGGESSVQFRLPDFRGEFLRGFDDGRGVDTGRTFASYQAGQIESHNHRQNAAQTAQFTPAPDTTLYYNMTGGGSTDFSSGPANQFTVFTGGSETRPRNKPVNYWIKY
jgi:microcystin-dependent protein